MADWTFIPDYPASMVEEPPPTVIQRYSDAGEHRRETHSTQLRFWTERYTFEGASEAASVRAFWKARRLVNTFTKVTYDENDAPAAEATVRFARKFRLRRTASDVWTAQIEFVEVAT